MLQKHEKKIFLSYIVAIVFMFTVVVQFLSQDKNSFLQTPPTSVNTLFKVSSPFFEKIEAIQEIR